MVIRIIPPLVLRKRLFWVLAAPQFQQKLVKQMISLQFVEMAELIPENLEEPTRSRDLLAYMVLIIRTAKRFGGMSYKPTWLSPRAPGGTILPAAVYLMERRLMHQSKRTLSRRAPPMNVKGPTDESTIGLPHPTSETDHQITITPSLLQVIRSLLTPLPLWNMSHLVLCTLSVNSLD